MLFTNIMGGRHENGELYKGGFTSEQALKTLHEDIENVVLREELKFFNEKFVFSQSTPKTST